MLTPGHIALGYLVSVSFLKITHADGMFDADTLNVLLLTGSLMGTAPDLDFLPFFIKHRSLKLVQNDSHRSYATHAPLFWLIISLLAYFSFGRTLFAAYLGGIILLGTWSHFLADSFEYGIGWLRPFSQKRYAVWNYPEERTTMRQHILLRHYFEFLKIYVKSRTFPFEIVAVLAAAAVLAT
ncbi:MAG: metal-dependent hydrolase [Candidatus Liptonbacteria bacterium]|nr:metal-dependent hydrolase [Candidatus Liptonbacteria bacterium]MBI3114689.1 metal-dependent hydrolase [Candidatus Harrisonbacteria bacterium]